MCFGRVCEFVKGWGGGSRRFSIIFTHVLLDMFM